MHQYSNGTPFHLSSHCPEFDLLIPLIWNGSRIEKYYRLVGFYGFLKKFFFLVLFFFLGIRNFFIYYNL
ncbi:hypothetical protein CW304_21740 [Bacillus sp. UFRGS-B20]|nr:hypothetical protein CW304_21740 [Bacillus sp. UFRGS-B20]